MKTVFPHLGKVVALGMINYPTSYYSYASGVSSPIPRLAKMLVSSNSCRFPLMKTSFSKLSAVNVDLLGLRLSEPMLNS